MAVAVNDIADRSLSELHKLEWAIGYKRALRDRCISHGELHLANTLAQEIADLEQETTFHKLAWNLTRSAG